MFVFVFVLVLGLGLEDLGVPEGLEQRVGRHDLLRDLRLGRSVGRRCTC